MSPRKHIYVPTTSIDYPGLSGFIRNYLGFLKIIWFFSISIIWDYPGESRIIKTPVWMERKREEERRETGRPRDLPKRPKTGPMAKKIKIKAGDMIPVRKFNN